MTSAHFRYYVFLLTCILIASGAKPFAAAAQSVSASDGLIVSSTKSTADSFMSPPSARAPWSAFIADAARRHDLPEDFLTRLLRQESSLFNLSVSHAGAQGIAQFMPRTASSRGLDDPFNPEKAIPAAASYLNELRRQFGNLGLAAAAYNGGAGRVSDWLKGGPDLPAETRQYVLRITGRSVDEWAGHEGKVPALLDMRGPATAGLSRQSHSARRQSLEAKLCETSKGAPNACIVQNAY